MKKEVKTCIDVIYGWTLTKNDNKNEFDLIDNTVKLGYKELGYNEHPVITNAQI